MKTNQLLLSLTMITLLVAVSCKATKKMAYTPVGSWDYKVTGTPQGDVEGTMILTKTGDSYSGTMTAMGGSIDLDDVKIEDNKLTCTFDYQGYTLDVSGTFEGETFKGEIGMDYNGFPMTATRMAKATTSKK